MAGNAAGLVTIGTTTMPELAFNAFSEALQYGPTRNPCNQEHSAGGSSGGAGAAVGSVMDMERAMGFQNAVSRVVGQVMRRYDVLLTPGLAREVAKLGDLDQNANGVDLLGWWDQIICNYSAFTALFNTTGQLEIVLPWVNRKPPIYG